MGKPDLFQLEDAIRKATLYHGAMAGSIVDALADAIMELLEEAGVPLDGVITTESLTNALEAAVAAGGEPLIALANGVAEVISGGSDTSIEQIFTRFVAMPEVTRALHSGAMMPTVNPGENVKKATDGSITGWGFV